MKLFVKRYFRNISRGHCVSQIRLAGNVLVCFQCICRISTATSQIHKFAKSDLIGKMWKFLFANSKTFTVIEQNLQHLNLFYFLFYVGWVTLTYNYGNFEKEIPWYHFITLQTLAFICVETLNFNKLRTYFLQAKISLYCWLCRKQLAYINTLKSVPGTNQYWAMSVKKENNSLKNAASKPLEDY